MVDVLHNISVESCYVEAIGRNQCGEKIQQTVAKIMPGAEMWRFIGDEVVFIIPLKNQNVYWWLYEGADISGFKLRGRRMINKELCFNIENNNLYLEQILVDYMEVPIFFLCRGANQYYVALCTDIAELHYIVAKLSLPDVYNLLHGKIPMRDVILKQNEYWEIVSGDEICLDVVTKKNIDAINTALLPEANAFFEILTKQMELFVQKFTECCNRR